MCHHVPHPDDIYGMAHNWCSPTPCPPVCTVDEILCPFMPPPNCTGDACMGHETCAPKAAGCPVTCMAGEHMCHHPPHPDDIYGMGMNWCSPTPCPPVCTVNETYCPFMPPPGCMGDACMGADTCAPLSTGCPVHCNEGDKMCHMPPHSCPYMPDMPPMPAFNFCIPNNMFCPAVCAEDEMNCPFMPPPGCMGDACMGPETCAPKSAGCPVTCMAGEHMCHMPPHPDDIYGMAW